MAFPLILFVAIPVGLLGFALLLGIMIWFTEAYQCFE